MRNILLIALFAISIFAKDNYIFDYKYDPMIAEKIERLEKEIGELKASNINLKKTQSDLINRYQNRPEPKVDLSGIERELAQLKRAVATTKAPKQTSAKPATLPASYIKDKIAIEEAIESLKKSVDLISNSSHEFTKINRQISLLNERVSTQEIASKNQTKSEMDMPFSDYISLDKTQLEYVILGLLIFIALIFLLTTIALNRAKKAEEKVAQIVKLYQSSSRKIEDKK